MKLLIEKLTPTAKLPTRAHFNDAGLDLYADESLSLSPGQRTTIKTGLRLAIPTGHAGLIWDKSGLALNHGLHCLAGVIDAGYRGEVSVVVINLGQENHQIIAGQKIAQLLIQTITQPDIEETSLNEASDRGQRGFGSSGL